MKKPEIEIADLIKECQARTGKLVTIGTAESATGGRIAARDGMRFDLAQLK
ncbi:unnamed protein product [marine sediment metagenome]|uniref:Uncharacterized protein n=1 Tax=marine sediment metagenome TaxID=412755 RepID=X1P5C6_9ZZZZ